MGLSSSDKTKVLRHLNDMADSLPEHPTPAEAKHIVDGALKKVGAGQKKDDEEKPEEKPEEKKEKKEDKPKEEKKEKVEEARKLSFKAFISEATKSVTVRSLLNIIISSTMPQASYNALKDTMKYLAPTEQVSKDDIEAICASAGVDPQEVLDLVGLS